MRASQRRSLRSALRNPRPHYPLLRSRRAGQLGAVGGGVARLRRASVASPRRGRLCRCHAPPRRPYRAKANTGFAARSRAHTKSRYPPPNGPPKPLPPLLERLLICPIHITNDTSVCMFCFSCCTFIKPTTNKIFWWFGDGMETNWFFCYIQTGRKFCLFSFMDLYAILFSSFFLFCYVVVCGVARLRRASVAPPRRA